MTGAWVAGASRARMLLSHCVGADGARELALARAPGDAVRRLSATAYGRFLDVDAAAGQAQRAVTAALLWQLRVLAGWLPSSGIGMMRALAAGFEIANTEDLLRSFTGAEVPEPYRLGSLATAWRQLDSARSPTTLRAALAHSAWGDPGGEDAASVALCLRLAAADRAARAAPPLRRWAAGRGALLVARTRFAAGRRLPAAAARRAQDLLGSRCMAAGTYAGFRTALRSDASWALAGVTDPVDLWQAESRWWSAVDRDGRAMLRGTRYGSQAVIGAVAVLSADAWRVRAGLGAAARHGAGLEVLDAAR